MKPEGLDAVDALPGLAVVRAAGLQQVAAELPKQRPIVRRHLVSS